MNDVRLSIGDIVLLRHNIKYNKLGKYLSCTNHMFFISSIENDMITIHALSSNIKHMGKGYPDNYIIRDWSTAGLRKVSYINCNSEGVVPITTVYKVIGSLSNRDKESAILFLKNRSKILQKFSIEGN